MSYITIGELTTYKWENGYRQDVLLSKIIRVEIDGKSSTLRCVVPAGRVLLSLEFAQSDGRLDGSAGGG
jgi:hypothetical protein